MHVMLKVRVSGSRVDLGFFLLPTVVVVVVV